MTTRFALFLFLALVADCMASVASFSGRAVVPPGVDSRQVAIYLCEGPPSEVENDRQPELLSVRPDATGAFDVSTTSDTLNLTLEIAGPGVRRARFPWPETNGARAVFRLEPGVTTTLQVVDIATSDTVPYPVVGPIFPGSEATDDQTDKAFPFFAFGDATGRVVIDGLIPKTSYDFPVRAEGFARRVVSFPAGTTSRVELDRGGAIVEGRLIGAKTQSPWPREVVRAVSESGALQILVRTDEESRFRIAGLSPGRWLFAPSIERLGDMVPAELQLARDNLIRGFVLEVAEGIDLGVTVSDAETGLPLRGAIVAARNRFEQTDGLGRAGFERVTGPWPLPLEVELSGFEFKEEDQRDQRLPVNGYEGQDIADLALYMRRIRFLEVLSSLADGVDAPKAPAMLELIGKTLSESEEPQRVLHRIDSAQQVVRLDGAGMRVATMRRFDGFSGDLTVLTTEQEQTTTTLSMILGPGATLLGSLTYAEGPPAPTFRLKLRATVMGEVFDFAEAQPDSDGGFIIEALPPGTFMARFLRADGSTILEQEVVLERGVTTELNPTISRGQILAGQVVSPDGVGQVEIPIRAWGVDPQGNPLQRLVMSSEGGAFRIEGFGGGAISQIQIDHHMWRPMTIPAVPIPDDEYKITLQERSGIRVRALASPGALRVARAIVMTGVQRSDELATNQWYFTPSVQEAFGGEETAFISPRTTGYMQVAVEADGLWDVSEPFNWSLDTPLREITLTPAHRASLSIRFPGSKVADLRDAVVTLINTSLPEGQTSTSFTPTVRPPDSLTFGALPGGMYLLLVTSSRGDSITRTNLYIAGGERKELELPLKPSLFRMTGRVLESDGTRGIGGVTVSLRFGDLPEPPVIDSQESARDGSFEFVAVPGSRPLLLEAAREEARARLAIPALSGDISDLQLTFPKSVRVTFRIPARLQQRLSQNPNIPVILTSTLQGEGTSFRGDQADGTFTMWVGEYVAFWGEDLLGRVIVPKDGGEVELPDLREQR
ncbi:hypothetical protein GC173_17315 [bacterium]|nr:hypothetical protein [bacterium]